MRDSPAPLLALVLLVVPAAACADGRNADPAPQATVTATAYYYAMRDQGDFGVGVAAIDHGSLHLEARYNYEGRDVASFFAGWRFAGGDTVSFEVTPILGALSGAADGVVPGVELSLAYGTLDAYIEAEYVPGQGPDSPAYYYAWSELGWQPVHWLRVGVVGQRTRIVGNDRDIQRGPFAQLTTDSATLGIYAFNPDSGSRYVIVSLGVQF